MKNVEKGEMFIQYIHNMKAREVMEKYNITRRTLSNWVKKGLIDIEMTPSGRYIYFDKKQTNR
jgi:predicted site-specific integrase-resolvase